MIELMLVEGVSDVQLISYYLQNIYGWKYEKNNHLGIAPMEAGERIENLSRDGNHLVVCGVGGNGRFKHFAEIHRINSMIVEREISSVMIVTDRDEDTDGKICRSLNKVLDKFSLKIGEWTANSIEDSFGQEKSVYTYLLVIPGSESGALERVIIDALHDIPKEQKLIEEAERFVNGLKDILVPELRKVNLANKAAVGTFFSVKNPQNAMRSFGNYISMIDWSKSETLNRLFRPFGNLGEDKQSNENSESMLK